MGFHPTIIVRKSDLDKNRTKISQGTFSPDECEQRAYKKNEKALDCDCPVIFPELELIIITSPDLSSHNKDIRDLLEDLDIDFRLYIK